LGGDLTPPKRLLYVFRPSLDVDASPLSTMAFAMLTAKRLTQLKEILSQPAAPFREQHVLRCVCAQLDAAGVAHFTDTFGNIVVGVGSEKAYQRLLQQRAEEPVRVFIAHMDHPGFHGVRWLADNRLAIKWHGGSPLKHLAGAKLWLADDEQRLTGKALSAKLSKVKLLKAGWAIDSAEVVISTAQGAALRQQYPGKQAKKLFGSFAFRADHWLSGKRLYTRAADDLVGVFAVVSTAIALQGKNRPFIGLLTRAEEVGFVGAVQHFQQGWLQAARRPVVCVSLEASRTLRGAIVGKGPVVRLGDRRTTFDSGASQLLSSLAEKYLPGKHQRRLMDGGACEATAATAWGLPTIGITLPLGNYHNQGFEGGMDCPKTEGPAPEFVHLDDIEGELRLCHALMRTGLNWSDPWLKVRSRLLKNAINYKSLF
jgi:putative aminopeptidase FrvX